MKIKILGEDLYLAVLFNKKILAYSLHYDREKAIEHLNKIAKFHNLEGKILEEGEIVDFVYQNIINKNIFFKEYIKIYRFYEIYEFLIRLDRLTTYSEIAKKTKYNIWQVIQALRFNPFLILIPCHRIIRKDGKISGYTPLGKSFKLKLLRNEGFV